MADENAREDMPEIIEVKASPLEASPAPELTLTPTVDGDETLSLKATHAEMQMAQAAEEAHLADEALTEEEKKLVDDFSKQIDVRDTTMILQYGAGAQKKMADFADNAIASVKTQDLGEVGSLITDVVTELRGFDVTEEKGLFGFFKRAGNKLELMRAKYDKVDNNIDKIVGALKGHQVKLMKDTATLDKMYELNLTYFKELTMYIMAGKKKLAAVREGELAELIAKAKQTGRAEDAQAAQDLQSMCNRFEKKLSDLDLTRTIALQTAPQIRFVQNNDTAMVEKVQTTIVNTIPLWKSQMVLALGIANSQAAVKAQNAVTDMTNDLLRKNAEMLHQSTTQIARESERGIVDIETLKHTNEELIKTFDEVMQIQREGREKRAEAEIEMRRIEGELRDKLLEVQGA